MGNLLICMLIYSNTSLCYSPMYFLLSHLSLADLGVSSTTTPKMLQTLLPQTSTYSGCLTQLYFFVVFCTAENFLLASMAYDRFMAICYPLHYTTLMNYKNCLLLAVGCWLMANAHSLMYVLLVANFSFCASREIPHFFCDLHPLLRLSCSDTSVIEMLLVTEGTAAMLGPLMFVLLSYIFIISRVLKVPSVSGKYKAFSTCMAHFLTVVLFYGTLFATYIHPKASYSASQTRVAAVFYTVVIPMLNPFIYSLRNKEIQRAIKGLLRVWLQKRSLDHC